MTRREKIKAKKEEQWNAFEQELARTKRYRNAMKHFCEGLTLEFLETHVEFMETHKATEWIKIEDIAEGIMKEKSCQGKE